MLRKAFLLGLGPIGLLAGANVASASISQQCPYDVADWDVDPALIQELCEEWARSQPKGGDKYKVKGSGPKQPSRPSDDCGAGTRPCEHPN